MEEIIELKKKLISVLSPEQEKFIRADLDRLERLPPFSSDYQRTLTYLEFLAELPWNAHQQIRVDLRAAKRELDKTHYGLDDVKQQLLEYMTVVSSQPRRHKPVVMLMGPSGMGKVTLSLSVARCLDLPVERIHLATARGKNFMWGENRYQANAGPGSIMRALQRVKVNNPIIILEELDHLDWNLTDNPGAPLIELLDERNLFFTDEYVGMPFDISQIWFIVTANSLDKVPRVLSENMGVIEFPGYPDVEKLHIAENFLIPDAFADTSLNLPGQNIEQQAILKIIRRYTRESGVSQLKQCIQKIARKLATKGKLEGADNVGTQVTPLNLSRFLGPEWFFKEEGRDPTQVGVAAGLVWTAAGGEVIYVEAVRLPKGRGLILTGRLGKVMRESAETALSFLWAHVNELSISERVFTDSGIHIHVPAGAISKDGPSAGITILIALASLLLNKAVGDDIAMTGEISLTGQVFPVGGIREKVLAAHRAGFKKLLLPWQNEADLEYLPEDVRSELQFVFVQNVRQVLPLIFPDSIFGPVLAPEKKRLEKEKKMKLPKMTEKFSIRDQSGKIGWILLWLVGIPIPVLIVLWLIRGGT